jgi:hypothetical protein
MECFTANNKIINVMESAQNQARAKGITKCWPKYVNYTLLDYPQCQKLKSYLYDLKKGYLKAVIDYLSAQKLLN